MPANNPTPGQQALFEQDLGINKAQPQSAAPSSNALPASNISPGQQALFEQDLQSSGTAPVESAPVQNAIPATPNPSPEGNESSLKNIMTQSVLPIAAQAVGLGNVLNTAQSGNLTGFSGSPIEGAKEVLNKAETFANNFNRATTIDAHNSLAATLALYNKAIPGGPNPIISNWISNNYNSAKDLEQQQQQATNTKTLGPIANFVSQNPVTSAVLAPVAGEVGAATAAGGILAGAKAAAYIGGVGTLYNTLNSFASHYIDTAHDPSTSQEELETNLAEHAGVNIGGALIGGVAGATGQALSEAKSLGANIMNPLKNALSKTMEDQTGMAKNVLELNNTLKGGDLSPVDLETQASKMNYNDIVQAHNENADMFQGLLNRSVVDPENPNFAPNENIAQLGRVQSILQNSDNSIYQQNAVDLKNAITSYQENQKSTNAQFNALATNPNSNPMFQAEAQRTLQQVQLTNPQATLTDLPDNLKTQTLFNYAKNIGGETAQSARGMIASMGPEEASNLISQHIDAGSLSAQDGEALQSYYNNSFAKNQTNNILDILTQRVTKDPNLMDLDQQLSSLNPNISQEDLTSHLVNSGIVNPQASQIARNISANTFISQYADHMSNNRWNPVLDGNFQDQMSKYQADANNGLFLRETSDKLNQLQDLYAQQQTAQIGVNQTTKAVGEQINNMSNSLGIFNDPQNSNRIDSLLDLQSNNQNLAGNFQNLFNSYKSDLSSKQYNAWDNHANDSFQSLYENSLNPDGTTNKPALVSNLQQNPISQQLANTVLTTAKALNNKLPGYETSILGTKDGAFVLSEMGRLLDENFVNSLTPAVEKKMTPEETSAFNTEKLKDIYENLADRVSEQGGSIKPTLETLANFNDLISKRAAGYEVHPQMTASNVQYQKLQQLMGNAHSDLRRQLGTDYYRSIGYDKPGQADTLVDKLNNFYGKFRGFQYDFNKQTGLHLEGLPEQNKIAQLADTLQKNEGTPYQWVENNVKPLHDSAMDFYSSLHENDPLMQSYLGNKFTLANQNVSQGMARSISSQIANNGKTPLTPQGLKLALANSNSDNMQKIFLTNPALGQVMFRDGVIERNGTLEPYKGLRPTSEIISNLAKTPDAQNNMKLIQQNYPELYTHIQGAFRDKIVSDASHMGTNQAEPQLQQIAGDIQKYAQIFGNHFTHFADADGNQIPNLSIHDLSNFARTAMQNPKSAEPYLHYINGLSELSQFNSSLKDVKNGASMLANPTINQANKSILIDHVKQRLDEIQKNIDASSSATNYNQAELSAIKEPLKNIQDNLGDMHKVADGLLKVGQSTLDPLQKNIISAQKMIQAQATPQHGKLVNFLNMLTSPVKKPLDYISSITQSYMANHYKEAFPDLLHAAPSAPYGMLQNKAAIKSIGDAIQNKQALADYYDSVNKTKLTKKNAALMTALLGATGSH